MYRAQILSVVFALWSLCIAASSQTTTSDSVALRIEAVGRQISYPANSSLPIRCHFRNISDRSVTIKVPDEFHSMFPRNSSRMEITMTRVSNGKDRASAPEHSLGSAGFCRHLSGQLDSDVKCESPGKPITLAPGEEVLRVIPLRFFLGRLKDVTEGSWPEEYRIQVSNSQDDSTLLSNQLTIVVEAPDSMQIK